MKIHEENKIVRLLNYLNYTDEETEKIIDAIDNKNVGEDELIELMENLKKRIGRTEICYLSYLCFWQF